MLLTVRTFYIACRFGLAAVLLTLVFSVQRAPAAEPTTVRLWQDGAPGTPPTKPEDEPVLFMRRPAEPNSAAVIVLPGGGYGHLAITYEGHDVADWFNSFGVTAFVLKYRMRTTGHTHPIPMRDGQRAIRTVRARAAEWKINPSRIGVLGFSAGGHLASTLGTHFDDGDPKSADPIDRVSSRPDFLILCYPVISLDLATTHRGSRENLLGKSPDPQLVRSLSNETQVTPKTPPTFLFHTSEDKAVPPENSVAFYRALQKAGVPAELHIFQSGRHGVGLAKDVPGANNWPELCRQWLKNRGLLQPDKR
jgi:acetyl esterase/lipase